MTTMIRISAGIFMSLTLISCASTGGGPEKRKGPSPYSASFSGETVTPLEPQKCATDDAYMKQTWKGLVATAANCVRAKNFFQVERVANHLAKIEPNSHWGAYFLSLAAESRKDYPRALWMAELALKKAPEDGILLFQRARLNWLADNKAAAIPDLKEAVKRNPSITEAHLLLGQIQFTMDEMSNARKSFQTVLSQDSKRGEALFGMGEVAFKQNNLEESYDYHKRASQIDPSLGVSFMRLAQIQEIHYKDLKASLEAYKDLQRRVSLNRVQGDLPMDVSEKVKSLTLAVQQQSVAKTQEPVEKTASKREPSGKKVSK